jgi:hypothetical protein
VLVGTVTLTPPWEGASPPSPDYHGVHASAYFEAVFTHIGEAALSLLTENMEWLIFAIAVTLAVTIGNRLWSYYHPGEAYGRARDAQYSTEIDEVSAGER